MKNSGKCRKSKGKDVTLVDTSFNRQVITGQCDALTSQHLSVLSTKDKTLKILIL